MGRCHLRLGIAAARKTKPAEGGSREPFRNRPGTIALREIRKLQNSTELLIPKKPFVRLMLEIVQDRGGDSSFKPKAVEDLQVACEDCIN